MLIDFAKHILLRLGLEPIALENALYLYVSPPDRPLPLKRVAAIVDGRVNIDEWATFMDEYSRGFHH